MNNDLNVLRALAEKYAEAALDGVNAERTHNYREINSLKATRPPVLVFEVPFGEFSDCDELRLKCADGAYRSLEWELRSELYKWNHFCGDYALHPYYRCHIAVNNSGIGIGSKEKTIPSQKGGYIMAHEYEDVLKDDEALARVRIPEISLNKEHTESRLAFCSEIFEGILPVKKAGVSLYLSSWDTLSVLRGMSNCMYDLYDNPEFMHRVMERFTRVNEQIIEEYDRLNIYDTDPYYLHCTPACTYELPVKDMDKERITARDVWCRAMAQPLAVVSPEMFGEFDLQYTQRLFDKCGLAYYGCCEPLHDMIDMLRRFPNLRRISITPWADVDMAAERIGSDYVLSYKPNPAYVAERSFDPAPVIAETKRVLEACRRNGTPCEFILKDISSVSNNPDNLTQWVNTVNSVIDRYF